MPDAAALTLDAGYFEAHVVPGSDAPIVARFFLLSDPTNFTRLKLMRRVLADNVPRKTPPTPKEARTSARQGRNPDVETVAMGEIVGNRDSGLLVWSVTKAHSMEALGATLEARGGLHSRLPVAQAWLECVRLLPAQLKATLALQGERYHAREYDRARGRAVATLHEMTRANPPSIYCLPPRSI